MEHVAEGIAKKLLGMYKGYLMPYLLILVPLLVYIAIGTVLGHIEGWSAVDSFYTSCVMLTTVGTYSFYTSCVMLTTVGTIQFPLNMQMTARV
jgi:hypothetical protein